MVYVTAMTLCSCLLNFAIVILLPINKRKKYYSNLLLISLLSELILDVIKRLIINVYVNSVWDKISVRFSYLEVVVVFFEIFFLIKQQFAVVILK